MRIWLIKIGEPLPIDEGDDRPFRMGLIAESLLARGHEVVWWSSTFNHAKRCLRADRDTVRQAGSGLEVRLIHAPAYHRNRSLRRLANHVVTARKLGRAARLMPRPDVVLCALPTPELCKVAVSYGRRQAVPVVIDIRDLWPDIFLEMAPHRLRGLMRLALAPYYRMTSRALAGASSVIGVTPPYVEWGRRLGRRAPSALDRAFPMGYPDRRPATHEIEEAERFWAERHDLRRGDDRFIGCFLGVFSRQFELETVVQAGRQLAAAGNTTVRLVLCGDGEQLGRCRELAAGCRQVVLPGWVSWPRLWSLMRISKFGIAPYKSIDNFTLNLPNKPIEYLSAGLPIVSSLTGQLEQLLAEEGCGITYHGRDARQLAEVIMSIAAAPERLEAMSGRASALFRSRFVASEVYGRLGAHLEQVVEQAGR